MPHVLKHALQTSAGTAIELGTFADVGDEVGLDLALLLKRIADVAGGVFWPERALYHASPLRSRTNAPAQRLDEVGEFPSLGSIGPGLLRPHYCRPQGLQPPSLTQHRLRPRWMLRALVYTVKTA